MSSGGDKADHVAITYQPSAPLRSNMPQLHISSFCLTLIVSPTWVSNRDVHREHQLAYDLNKTAQGLVT